MEEDKLVIYYKISPKSQIIKKNKTHHQKMKGEINQIEKTLIIIKIIKAIPSIK